MAKKKKSRKKESPSEVIRRLTLKKAQLERRGFPMSSADQLLLMQANLALQEEEHKTMDRMEALEAEQLDLVEARHGAEVILGDAEVGMVTEGRRHSRARAETRLPVSTTGFARGAGSAELLAENEVLRSRLIDAEAEIGRLSNTGRQQYRQPRTRDERVPREEFPTRQRDTRSRSGGIISRLSQPVGERRSR